MLIQTLVYRNWPVVWGACTPTAHPQTQLGTSFARPHAGLTEPVCAKMALPFPPPVVPDPESLAAQAAYTEAQLPGSGLGPTCFQASGYSPGLLQDPIL
jgi:hypothetical protein